MPRTHLLVMHSGGNSKSPVGWLRCVQVKGPLRSHLGCPPDSHFSSSSPSATPKNTRSRGPSLPENRSPWLWPQECLYKQPLPSIAVSGELRGLDRIALALRRLKVQCYHLTDGLQSGEGMLLFFPGLSRGTCHEDVEVAGPRQCPQGLTDTSSCWGTRVPGPGSQHRAPPLRLPPRAPPDLSTHPTADPAPTPSRGKGLGGASLGWGP
jgi:hypothetical protein